MWRIGEGYDIHALEPGRPLFVGCVEIPAQKGSVGQSDGDVLAHAMCDAVFGALRLDDIGTHYPPEDPRWQGVASRVFLEGAAAKLRERGGRLVNVDSTVILEKPRLRPHVDEMRAAVAAALGCDPAAVSIKAKSAEGFGAVGEGRAIEARAVVLVELDER